MPNDYEQLLNVLQKGVNEGTMTEEFTEAWTAILRDAYHAGAQAGYEEAKREAGLWTSF